MNTAHNVVEKEAEPCLATTSLEFPDNQLMALLCGELDTHLVEIEDALTLQIIRRGNQITLGGKVLARTRAIALLKNLYERLEKGAYVDRAIIQSTLKMGMDSPFENTAENTPPPANGGGIYGQPIRTRKAIIEPRTKAQKAFIEALLSKQLVFGIGPAGTGKTYLALAVGVKLFISRAVDRIILSRPAVEAGERLGFLPGDMKEKIDPYMQPLYDALNDFLPSKQLARMLDDKRVEIAPLAFMRGRTLNRAFILLDEAQNTTAMQMKMFLTRLGEGAHMVVTGDPSQIDLPHTALSGLIDAERRLKSIKSVAFARFSASDILRHPLVSEIVKAYDTRN